jgi:hypothetical protein
MDVELLYEPPFTFHAPHGPEDCSAARTSTWCITLTAVRARAGLAEGVAWPTHASDSQERERHQPPQQWAHEPRET